jgi:sugar O-acyltransferase (sialic acid O-acetyltransferase NeuD family)
MPSSATVCNSYVIFGGGGHASSVIDAIQRRGGETLAVVDASGRGPPGIPIVTVEAEGMELAAERGVPSLVAIGDNRVRLRIIRRLLDSGLHCPFLIASTATVSGSASLGFGSVVLEHAHVGPNARLGVGCIVNTRATVEHHAEVGDGSHVAPSATLAGEAWCGTRSLVGAGAVILPGVCVGDDVTIGAGAVVPSPISDGQTVAGVPARPSKSPHLSRNR